jgi:predicted acylesterase/phospholipase RssA
MKRRPHDGKERVLKPFESLQQEPLDLGVILSGGGVRAAYQAGALKALAHNLSADLAKTSVVIGSSIGAVNGLVFSACLGHGTPRAIETLEALWAERTFSNSFSGSRARAFLRAIRIAARQFLAPGPHNSETSVLDPEPLRNKLDLVIQEHGGLTPDKRAPSLKAVAVMTTIEGAKRKPLLFLSSHHQLSPEELQGASFETCYVSDITAKHGFASAALPAILPPVELDTDAGKVRLVDGGISQNVPVDPAVRLGAHRIIIIDISGRTWWFDRYGEPHDTRPSWEVPADTHTFCLRPPQTMTLRNKQPFGPILKHAISGSRKRFMDAVGALWPLFTLVKAKLGEELAYEVMSYVALDPEYQVALMELGYQETMTFLRKRAHHEFLEHEELQGNNPDLRIASPQRSSITSA